MTSAFVLGAKAAANSSAPARINSRRNGKARGRHVLNFRMYPPKARRITPLVTIPIGVARLFLEFFWLGGTRCPQGVGRGMRHCRRISAPSATHLASSSEKPIHLGYG